MGPSMERTISAYSKSVDFQSSMMAATAKELSPIFQMSPTFRPDLCENSSLIIILPVSDSDSGPPSTNLRLGKSSKKPLSAVTTLACKVPSFGVISISTGDSLPAISTSGAADWMASMKV